MKMKIAEKRISVSSSRWGLYIFVLCGIISLITGITMYDRLLTTDHVLIGVGIIFTSGGMMFLLNTRNYNIEIDSVKEVLRINSPGRDKKNPLQIPLGYFTAITIDTRINKIVSGKKQISGYEINLISGSGSSLRISDFNNREDAIRHGKELQKILKIDLILDEKSILKNIVQHKEGTIQKGQEVTLPEKTGLVALTNGESVSITWNCRKALARQLFIIPIVYGFFHLIHFAVAPNAGNPIISIIAYGIISLLFLVTASIVIMNAAGSFHLIITPSTIEYYVNIFGKKTGKCSMLKTEIGIIKYSIGGQDDSIQIMSKKGLETVMELIDTFGSQVATVPDLSMARAIFSLKDEMMNINVSSLSMRDTWYIESMIVRG